MALSPWHKVAVPREDLRKRKPLDAAQFAVHLDRVAAGDAPPEYADPERFLSQTYITDGLNRFVGEVLRRLAGEREGSNAVLNLVTGFGGGKTHALTLLYHLGRSGASADALPGVRTMLDAAHLESVPAAAVAVFVGTEWDALDGRGGDGEAKRLTPWGEIAWQLSQQTGDPSLFEAVAEQDVARVRPGKSNIRKFLPHDRPVLILMDEVMNFMTAARAVTVGKSTLASQFYEFVHNLTDEADSQDGLCVVISLPKSEEEMSAEDEADFRRLAKVTTRVAEPYVLAKDLEIPEIVRRRLFDDPGSPADVKVAAKAFARWTSDHRDQIPEWFPVDNAEEVFSATYPFHPTVLSVFERKWQALPSFQRTRGVLRLLAQWVSITYEAGFKGADADPLVALGTAPLDDQFFRAAVLDQLGNEALQAAIISDIAGDQSNAERLDAAAEDTLKAARIHRKVATAIFFESSGGQVKDRATLREVRLAVGEPSIEIGNVETAVDALRDACYFLTAEGSEYRFSTRPNLNKLVADRRAALDRDDVEEHARAAVRRVFSETKGTESPFDVVFFPSDSSSIPDTPSLRLVVLPPDQGWGESVKDVVGHWMDDHGTSPRRFRNALIWSVAEESSGLLEAARKDRAWQSLSEEAATREFDETQIAELSQNRQRATRDLNEAVWRTYRWLAYLAHDSSLAEEDLGVVHSSSAGSIQALIQGRLRQADELTESLAPSRVVQNWPATGLERKPAWSTKGLRDSVFASPAFTRLLVPSALKNTISKGVEQGLFGYAVRGEAGYVRVVFENVLSPEEVEFSDDIELALPERARELVTAAPTPENPVVPEVPDVLAAISSDPAQPVQLFTEAKVAGLRWAGEVPWQQWTTFYNKVLSQLVGGGVKVTVEIDAEPADGLSKDRADAVRDNLTELGLSGDVEVKESDEGDG